MPGGPDLPDRLLRSDGPYGLTGRQARRSGRGTDRGPCGQAGGAGSFAGARVTGARVCASAAGGRSSTIRRRTSFGRGSSPGTADPAARRAERRSRPSPRARGCGFRVDRRGAVRPRGPQFVLGLALDGVLRADGGVAGADRRARGSGPGRRRSHTFGAVGAPSRFLGVSGPPGPPLSVFLGCPAVASENRPRPNRSNPDGPGRQAVEPTTIRRPNRHYRSGT